MSLSSSTKMVNSEQKSGGFNFAQIWDRFGMLMVFAGLFLLCCLFVPYFATFVNMKGLGLAISMSGMVACAMLFCLACGDLDLSVASVIACSGVVTAVAINATSSVVLGIGAGLLSGVLFGLLNGFVIAKLQINALITTLATMQIARGLGYIISDGKAVGITEESFFTLGNSSLFGIPTPVWLTIVTFAVFAFLLNRTVYGRNTLAIGGNEEAARLAGVNVVKTKMLIFTISGFISALAGVILAARMT
ncbi:L-arabinose ABC transporter permease AraH, partial [Vibrio fluvialis]|nr:L-arabinose ABC transporter permease AraH [Vibrio fluvialis]